MCIGLSEALKGEMVNRSTLKIAGMLGGILLLCSAFNAISQDKKPLREFELRADSPEFWKLIPKQAKLETVAAGLRVPERAPWDKSGLLYASAEEVNKIFRVSPAGHQEGIVNLGEPVPQPHD